MRLITRTLNPHKLQSFRSLAEGFVTFFSLSPGPPSGGDIDTAVLALQRSWHTGDSLAPGNIPWWLSFLRGFLPDKIIFTQMRKLHYESFLLNVNSRSTYPALSSLQSIIYFVTILACMYVITANTWRLTYLPHNTKRRSGRICLPGITFRCYSFAPQWQNGFQGLCSICGPCFPWLRNKGQGDWLLLNLVTR